MVDDKKKESHHNIKIDYRDEPKLLFGSENKADFIYAL